MEGKVSVYAKNIKVQSNIVSLTSVRHICPEAAKSLRIMKDAVMQQK